MIKKFNEKNNLDNIGNKAKFLIEMSNKGFNVPEGIVLTSKSYDQFIENHNLESKINDQLSILTIDKVGEVSQRISDYFDGLSLSDLMIKNLETLLDEEQKYAVRSSGLKEDLKDHSFAGQYDTFLNVKGLNNLNEAVIACYKSMFSETILTYLLENNFSFDDFKMAVIIQEMVDADYSGVAFTVNPMTGKDTEIVMEIAKGLGENIVSGNVNPDQYIYDWYKQDMIKTSTLLEDKFIIEISEVFLSIQEFYGYPSDIEFSIKDGELYILQSRAITKLTYSGLEYQWTTANFKDGGVSSQVCYKYMWSLYEYIWNISFGKYVNEAAMVPKSKMGKLSDMYFSRPYWNLSMAKLGMSQVIGYKERNFDEELGIEVTYEGDGDTTNFSLSSLISVLKIFYVNHKMSKDRLINNETYKQEIIDQRNYNLKQIKEEMSLNEFEKTYLKVIFDDYFISESTYFDQIFINTVAHAIFEEKLNKYANEQEKLNLISNLDDVSHSRPYFSLWDLSRLILTDDQALLFWSQDESIILDELSEDVLFYKEFKQHLDTYGYHSDRELDLTYPHHIEEIDKVIRALQKLLKLDDTYSPYLEKEKQEKHYKNQLKVIQSRVRPRKYKALLKDIEKIRTLLWWREEFKDLSTHNYYVIRLYTLRLETYYLDEGILLSEGDIWHLKINDIRDFIKRKINVNTLQKRVNRNKMYYNSFRNYDNDYEIGNIVNQKSVNLNSDLQGVGCSSGIVTGTARVIEDVADIDLIQAEDILVTRFTDTGWTSTFPLLKGIVTEHGGTLCHAAIVSREYGIPCVVNARHILNHVNDGDLITIDGSSGNIVIEEKRN